VTVCGNDDAISAVTSRRAGLLRRLEEGLYSSVNGNAQSFGFSITVTVCFGVASRLQSLPTLTDLLLFALAGVMAFSALNLFAALRLRTQVTQIRSTRATLIGTATDFIAVAAAVGAAIGLNHVTSGPVAWAVTPFVAAVIYVSVQSIELAMGERESEDDDDDDDDEPVPSRDA